MKTQQDASKAMSKTNDDQNRTNGQLKASHTFHRIFGVRHQEPTKGYNKHYKNLSF
jgi:hypothetical protein